LLFQALEDLGSVETAFSDLHQRYERTKGVVENFKKVGVDLTHTIACFQCNITIMIWGLRTFVDFDGRSYFISRVVKKCI